MNKKEIIDKINEIEKTLNDIKGKMELVFTEYLRKLDDGR